MANQQEVVTNLLNSLKPEQNIRQPAEKWLISSMSADNFGPLLLNLVQSHPDAGVKLVASITFKNLIKKYWGSEDDGDNKINEQDRNVIRSQIIELMLKSDEQYQKVLSEAVTIIGKYDFPSKWENLFDQLIGYFGTGDFHIINGVLRTIHSITKRYRYETKCDDLWREIKFVLEKFAIPFTELFVKIFDYSKEQADNPKAIKVIVSSLVQCAKIFYTVVFLKFKIQGPVLGNFG